MFDMFISASIEQNEDAYRLDSKRDDMVFKRYEDGIEEPADMASYAVHHARRLRKTNSITDQTKLVFCDLTAEEIATSFVRFTDPALREQLRAEVKFGSLLETA